MPCFASTSISVTENAEAQKKNDDIALAVALPEAIKSAESEEENAKGPSTDIPQEEVVSSQVALPDAIQSTELEEKNAKVPSSEVNEVEIASIEKAHAESGVPSLSIESVTNSRPEQEFGDTLQASARGSQEYLESELEFVREQKNAETAGSYRQAEQSTQDNKSEEEGKESVTTLEDNGADSDDEDGVAENEAGAESEEDDEDDEDVDEYKEMDEARFVRLNDVVGAVDVESGTTALDTTQSEQSGKLYPTSHSIGSTDWLLKSLLEALIVIFHMSHV